MPPANLSIVLVMFLALAVAVGGCNAPGEDPSVTTPSANQEIDRRSYDLGVIGAFAEMVGVGVKKMALSATLTPDAADALEEEAGKIAERNGAMIYRESDFLVTDLFPASVTEGKHVLVIYSGSTLEEYLALKSEKKKLVDTGQYEGTSRKAIAQGMGILLSYPEQKIEEMLTGK